MKIITILGSPRRKGNTAAVLGRFECLVAAQHAVERIFILDYAVKGCLGCDVCQRVTDAPGCRQKDDGVALLERLLAADLIVYATPVYGWSYPAEIKAFVDRHYCLVKWQGGQVASELFKGKRAALLATCGGSAEANADLLFEMFDRQMDYLGGVVVGKYVVPNCTTPARLGPAAERMAAQMALDLTGAAVSSGLEASSK
jgi:multimeric flavodoxin WrbA